MDVFSNVGWVEPLRGPPDVNDRQRDVANDMVRKLPPLPACVGVQALAWAGGRGEWLTSTGAG